MPTQKDTIFAKVAVQNKLLSQAKAHACLKAIEQAAADGKKVSMFNVVLHNKLLAREQVLAVERAVDYTLTKSRDRGYANIVIERGLATQEDIDEAIKMQDEFYGKKNQTVSLLEILNNSGKLKREDLVGIMQEEEKRDAAAPPEVSPPSNSAKVTSKGKVKVERAGKCKVAVRTISLSNGRDVTSMELSGALDADGFQELQRIIETAQAKSGDEGKYLVLNMGGVDYMSSAGVGVIVAASRTATTKGGAFKLANPSREVKEVMGLVGLDKELGLLSMDKTLEEIGKA